MHFQGHSLIALLFGVGFVACNPPTWTGSVATDDPLGLNVEASSRIKWEENASVDITAIAKFVNKENLGRLNDKASASRGKGAQLVLDTAQEVHDAVFTETRYPLAIK